MATIHRNQPLMATIQRFHPFILRTQRCTLGVSARAGAGVALAGDWEELSVPATLHAVLLRCLGSKFRILKLMVDALSGPYS